MLASLTLFLFFVNSSTLSHYYSAERNRVQLSSSKEVDRRWLVGKEKTEKVKALNDER